jgi:thymidylate synthase ThyX
MRAETSRLADNASRSDGKSATAAIPKQNASSENENDLVRLLYADSRADEKIAAALLVGASRLSYAECADIVERMTGGEKENFFRTVLREMKVHDAAPREFEHASMTLELVVSASCFAQLKRHRMATISTQRYEPALGVTIPSSVQEIGMEAALRNICLESEKTAQKIAETAPAAAAYILTNAHRRRVVMTINARELYHIARVRADRHAQWDIRRTAEKITTVGKEAMPLALMLACGKDAFDAIYTGKFGK